MPPIEWIVTAIAMVLSGSALALVSGIALLWHSLRHRKD